MYHVFVSTAFALLFWKLLHISLIFDFLSLISDFCSLNEKKLEIKLKKSEIKLIIIALALQMLLRGNRPQAVMKVDSEKCELLSIAVQKSHCKILILSPYNFLSL